eukprot:1159097-Pelagomonas_calceolata.AAC.1
MDPHNLPFLAPSQNPGKLVWTLSSRGAVQAVAEGALWGAVCDWHECRTGVFRQWEGGHRHRHLLAQPVALHVSSMGRWRQTSVHPHATDGCASVLNGKMEANISTSSRNQRLCICAHWCKTDANISTSSRNRWLCACGVCACRASVKRWRRSWHRWPRPRSPSRCGCACLIAAHVERSLCPPSPGH